MRIGAATNQAVSVAVALVKTDQLGGDPAEVATYVEELAPRLLDVMNALQATTNVVEGFGGTVVEAKPTVKSAPAAASQSATAPSGDTEYSGITRPIVIADHLDILPDWLVAQASAKGVESVWDNRGKDNYKNAIKKGWKKTPPPFRDSAEGSTHAFWPPESPSPSDSPES
jgi:hypothetical protein